MTVALTTVDIVAGYDDRTVLAGLSVEVPPGRFTVVIGPNACGKSTLLRTLARLLRPRAGTVLLDGADLHRLPPRELATRLGVLPQSPLVPEGVTVAELVARGRSPYQRWWRQWSAADARAVDAALRLADVADLADRPVEALSGGQRQRVWIAMALAQQTDLLLLDEPTTYLDVAHQVEVLDLLLDLNAAHGTTIVMVLHDLNLAARYADHLIAMADGRVYAAGDPGEVLTAETVRAVFGLECHVLPDPTSGRPMILPLGRHRASAPVPVGVA